MKPKMYKTSLEKAIDEVWYVDEHIKLIKDFNNLAVSSKWKCHWNELDDSYHILSTDWLSKWKQYIGYDYIIWNIHLPIEKLDKSKILQGPHPGWLNFNYISMKQNEYF